MQEILDNAWKNKTISSTTLSNNAPNDLKLAYWLMVQTGDPTNPVDRNRIGCKPPATACEKVRSEINAMSCNKLCASRDHSAIRIFYLK